MTFNWRILFLLLLSLMLATPTFAVHERETRTVKLVYSGTDDVTLANVHYLDSMLTGHFSDVQLLDVQQVEENTLLETDIVVYYAAKRTPETQRLSSYNGTLLGIGEGATELPHFKGWTFKEQVEIVEVDSKSVEYPLEITNVTLPASATVHVSGRTYEATYPVIMSEGNRHFVNSPNLHTELKYSIARQLYTLLEIDPPTTHLAYLRLEDISPVSDPALVREAGMYLLERGIPVYLAVIPVYVNPQTGEEVTLKDTPEMLEVLQQLVAEGAYIISHGYTHSYRYSETGEGFEFWDSVVNQPITTLDVNEKVQKVAPSEDFPNAEAYETYRAELKQVEITYTRDKLERSIQLLTRLGLPPVAFEAPHYTMSSTGYNVASDYFTAMFGQIQASDRNWQVMTGPLFLSTPSLLNGMTLYPETIGFVDVQLADPLGEMEERLQDVLSVPGAVIGGFYHPYLGMDYLKELVALLETVPNLEWINLRSETHSVKTDVVEITLSGDGQMVVKDYFTTRADIQTYLRENPLEAALWGIVAVTGLFIVLFALYVTSLNARYRKRLFKERM